MYILNIYIHVHGEIQIDACPLQPTLQHLSNTECNV